MHLMLKEYKQHYRILYTSTLLLEWISDILTVLTSLSVHTTIEFIEVRALLQIKVKVQRTLEKSLRLSSREVPYAYPGHKIGRMNSPGARFFFRQQETLFPNTPPLINKKFVCCCCCIGKQAGGRKRKLQ